MGPPQAELNGPTKGWAEEWNLWEKEKYPINNLKGGSEMQKKEAKAGAELVNKGASPASSQARLGCFLF